MRVCPTVGWTGQLMWIDPCQRRVAVDSVDLALAQRWFCKQLQQICQNDPGGEWALQLLAHRSKRPKREIMRTTGEYPFIYWVDYPDSVLLENIDYMTTPENRKQTLLRYVKSAL